MVLDVLRERGLHGRDPEVVLEDQGDLLKFQLVNQLAVILVDCLKHYLGLRVLEGSHHGRPSELVDEIDEHILWDLRLVQLPLGNALVPDGLRERGIGPLDAILLLVNELLAECLGKVFVCAHQSVKHQVEEQELHEDQEEAPQDAAGAECRVRRQEHKHKVGRGAGHKQGVETVAERVEADVDQRSLLPRPALHLALGAREQLHGDPGEEEQGAHVERHDCDHLAKDLEYAPEKAQQLGHHAEQPSSRHEGDPKSRPEKHEYDAVRQLQRHHDQACINQLRLVVDHARAEAIKIRHLQLSLCQ
mmetsp:Transcript_64139/g.173172  ORF Transcript_64139/g.173172 Transcript_64139/m.173172 type:complete len:304 (+) Transcript_64139:1237-2148(+)